MRSIRASFILGALLTAFSLTLWLIARRAMALVAPGEELPFGWRLGLYLWLWYVRLAPFAVIILIVVVLMLVAMLGGANVDEERKGVVAWLVLGLSVSAVSAAALAVWESWHFSGNAATAQQVEWFHWALSVMPVLLVAMLSGPAAGVAAVRVQRRVQAPKGGLRAWHVGVLVALLSSLGPAVLILALWVWWRSGLMVDHRGRRTRG
jgi:hypothetical protein